MAEIYRPVESIEYRIPHEVQVAKSLQAIPLERMSEEIKSSIEFQGLNPEDYHYRRIHVTGGRYLEFDEEGFQRTGVDGIYRIDLGDYDDVPFGHGCSIITTAFYVNREAHRVVKIDEEKAMGTRGYRDFLSIPHNNPYKDAFGIEAELVQHELEPSEGLKRYYELTFIEARPKIDNNSLNYIPKVQN